MGARDKWPTMVLSCVWGLDSYNSEPGDDTDRLRSSRASERKKVEGTSVTGSRGVATAIRKLITLGRRTEPGRIHHGAMKSRPTTVRTGRD